ncbi:MAG: NADH:flavin oxidoreductase/NADH oxidase [Agriterribacter sp.]
MSLLFTPLTIGNITFRNRIVVSPMCQYSSVEGFATDWHLVHLGSRAVGGAALVIQEATAVSPEGRISPDDMGIWADEHIVKLQQITNFIHAQGAVAGIQLAHAGRKASVHSPWKGGKQIAPGQGGWQTVAPSAIPFREGDTVPLALDEAGIDKVIADFAVATTRAVEAGYKVIEIHAAHGYLLHEFLSPLTNQRTDDYGGSFDNRARLLYQVVDAVKTRLSDEHLLFVRISASDWVEGGWDIEESVKLSARLKQMGGHAIDVSSGGNILQAKIPLAPGYQAPFAERIRKEAGIITGAVGLITSAGQCEALLQAGKADLVLLAREMLRDPYFPLHASMELDGDAVFPVQYERAKMKKDQK